MNAAPPDRHPDGPARSQRREGGSAVQVTIQVARTSQLAASRLAQIRSMIVQAFDGDFSEEDWHHTLGGWHAIVSLDDPTLGPSSQIVSHAAVVPRRIWADDRWFSGGYVEGVATATPARGRGYGSVAMTAVNEVIQDRYELGALSTGVHAFYANLGWEPWQGTTAVVTAERVLPTADDDDSIMVLRGGPSIGLPLDGEIRCEARPGDDW